MQTKKLLTVFAVIALHSFSFHKVDAAERNADGISAETLTLGVVSEINRSEIEHHFSDFVRYAAGKLSRSSNFEGVVIVAPTTFQLVKLLEQRKVDFYMDSPYPTYIINQVHRAGKLLLRRWKRGKAEYQSLVFTKANSAVKQLEDLKGKTIAFEDPDSTSGYYLPKLFLQRKGFKLANKTRYDPHGAPTEIGYIFAYSQAKLVDWVLTNEVAAGAFSNDDLGKLDAVTRSKINILAQTERLPRHLVSVRQDFSPELTGRLEKILLAMHNDNLGRSILKKTDDTTKFDKLPGGEAGMRRRLLQTFYSFETK